MNYCNWCRYKNTNGFKNNAPQCNLHAKLTNRFRISTRIPDREEKKSCSYTQLIRTDWSPSLANMFERIQTHSNAFKWVDHLRLHDEIPLSPRSQRHSNGFKRIDRLHLQTRVNAFKRIRTHSNAFKQTDHLHLHDEIPLSPSLSGPPIEAAFWREKCRQPVYKPTLSISWCAEERKQGKILLFNKHKI